MNQENDYPELSSEEKLKVDNDVLRMKLKAEFGMKSGDSSLDYKTENEWLNYLYHFEKSYSKAKRVKVYDFIGRPEFKKMGSLNKNEIEKELNRLLDVMKQNNVFLDCLCDYDDDVIYEFITEELFEEETDDIQIDGMMHCFIYEEFHPNHDYDLRCLGKVFFEYFFEEDWNEIIAEHQLNENMVYNKRDFSREEYVKILLTFREHNIPFKLCSNNICEVEFDPESKTGTTKGLIKYWNKTNQTNSSNYSGSYILRCKYNDYYWDIYEIFFPGFE